MRVCTKSDNYICHVPIPSTVCCNDCPALDSCEFVCDCLDKDCRFAKDDPSITDVRLYTDDPDDWQEDWEDLVACEDEDCDSCYEDCDENTVDDDWDDDWGPCSGNCSTCTVDED